MDLFRVTLALITVFGLLGLLYFLQGRKKTGTPRLLASARSVCSGKFQLLTNQKRPAGDLQVLRRISLTPTHQLHLIQIAQETYLVCTHPQGCSVLRKGLLPNQDTRTAAPDDPALARDFARYAS